MNIRRTNRQGAIIMKAVGKLKNSNGFTLVELIVTLAIAAIVMVVAGNYLFLGNRMFADNEVKNTDKYIGDTIFSFIKEHLTEAGKMEILDREKVISGDEKPAYSHVFALSGSTIENTDGYLYFTNDQNNTRWNDEKANIYGNSFYRNNTIAYTLQLDKTDATNRSFILTIYVYNTDGEEVYKTGASIKNLNIALENKTGQIEIKRIGDSVYQEFRNPVVSYEERKDKKSDPFSEKAKEVRNYYIGTYEELWNTRDVNGQIDIKKVENFSKYANNNNNVGNDQIRAYVKGEDYTGTWPKAEKFPDDMISNPKIDLVYQQKIRDFLDKNDLYYQPMIGLDKEVDGSNSYNPNNKPEDFAEEYCFIFLSTDPQTHGQWKAHFVYDHENNIWYVSAKDAKGNMGTQGIVRTNWKSLKQQLSDTTKWLPLKEYLQE